MQAVFDKYIIFFCMNTGMNIKMLRKAKGWSQIELAEKLNTTQKVISDYETEKRKPPLERLPALSKIFEVTIEQLIGAEKVKIETTGTHIHKNSRSAKIQELFDKLEPFEQRAILKQVKALIK